MKYSLKNATDDSVESLCELFHDVFDKSVKPSEWRWKYQDPALLGHENVVLCDETGNIVGHAGAVILPGIVGDKSVPIAQICDVMLSKGARGRAGPTGSYAAFMSALFSQLRDRIPQGLYYGFPGKRPFLLGERLGFYRGTGAIGEWRLPITAPQRSLWPWWRLGELDWDDPGLDRIWHHNAAGYPGIAVLDRSYLSWRYRRHPSLTYRLYGVHAGLRLVGWIVVAQQGDVLRCVDRLMDDAHLDLALGLLARYGRTLGVRELAWWAPDGTPRPVGATSVDTGIIGTVVTASAAEFSKVEPFWQPGNTDVY